MPTNSAALLHSPGASVSPAAAPLRVALGLMSGTSMDGIDAALLTTDGRTRIQPGASLCEPYDPALRAQLRSFVLDGTGDVAVLERSLTLAHAAIVGRLLSQAGLEAADIDLVGFHGHTVRHMPEQQRTWQIGDGALLAAVTGIAVVGDFRSADMRAGGQGAPLVPLFHAALAAGQDWPVAVLNLGGVGNVTWLASPGQAGGDPDIAACDCGPGNALLDDWVSRHLVRAYDPDGETAASGTVDAAALAALLDHPFFRVAGPKSLDRNSFVTTPVEHLSVADGAATLAAFTAESAARCIQALGTPRRLLVTGGGRHNRAIMAGLAARFSDVVPVDTVGWQGDALEAQAFAYLAVRSADGLPLSLPSTTGVSRPTSGGVLHRPPAPAA